MIPPFTRRHPSSPPGKKTNLPPNVIGFRCTEEVTKNDYDNIVFPRVEGYLKSGHTLNYVFVVETPLKNFTAAAWIKDVWLGLKKIAKWHKVAIVSDSEGVRKFTDTAGHLISGEYKGFPLGNLAEAVKWVDA